MTDWERMGGEEGVRRLMKAFIDRVSKDFVIGFTFAGKDLPSIVEREVELAATHTGGPLKYQGRPLVQVHRALKLNRGQFRRRLALLRVVLREHGVDEEVIERWLVHDRKLEGVFTDGTECLP